MPKSLSKAAPQLARLSTILTCSICYEPLVRPVATPCGHTFCSLCIRWFILPNVQNLTIFFSQEISSIPTAVPLLPPGHSRASTETRQVKVYLSLKLLKVFFLAQCLTLVQDCRAVARRVGGLDQQPCEVGQVRQPRRAQQRQVRQPREAQQSQQVGRGKVSSARADKHSLQGKSRGKKQRTSPVIQQSTDSGGRCAEGWKENQLWGW